MPLKPWQYEHFSLRSLSKRAITVLSVIALVGCTYGHTAQKTERSLQLLGLKSQHKVERSGHWALAPNSSVLLAYPRSTTAVEMPRLCNALADHWTNAAERQFHRAFMAPMSTPTDELFDLAVAGGYDWVLEMVLVSVEPDNESAATKPRQPVRAAKSDKPEQYDGLVLMVHVYDAHTRRRFDVVRVESQAPLFPLRDAGSQKWVSAALLALTQPLAEPKTTRVF